MRGGGGGGHICFILFCDTVMSPKDANEMPAVCVDSDQTAEIYQCFRNRKVEETTEQRGLEAYSLTFFYLHWRCMAMSL